MTRRRLIWQLYPLYLLVIIIALGAATWYSTHFFHKFYLQQTADRLHTLAMLDMETIAPLLQSSSVVEIDKLCKKLGKLSKTRVTVINASGKVLGDSDENPAMMENHSNRPEFVEASQEDFGRSIRFSHTLGKNMMYIAVPLRQDDKISAFVRTAISLNTVEQILSNIHLKIAAAGIAAALIVAVLSFMISRHISGPVVQMERIAKEFEAGHLEHRVPIPNITEFAGLAGTLNEMARQLQNRINTITQQRNESEVILSSMTEGIVAVDTQGHIMSVNKATANLFGLQQEQIKGRDVEEIIRNNDLQQFIKDAINSEQPIQRDIVLCVDKERFFQLHGTGISDEDGNRKAAVIVFNDVTEIRRLENVRRDFVANVSHELKTPITSIKGFVETLLDEKVKDVSQINHFLQIISKHAERLNAITEDLLSLSRLEDGESKKEIALEKQFLKPVVKTAIELSKIKAAQKRITIEHNCHDTIKANANALLLEQAVFNLIDNAVKFSEIGGTIKVIAEQTDKEILISVQDNGCGIEQKHLERIFERFYVVDKSRSRKLGGTGLGLSIVKHIAHVHSGAVTVESTLGEGSTFTIHLPAD